MGFQRGSLLKAASQGRRRSDAALSGEHADGKRLVVTVPVCLVRDFPNEGGAWREIERLGLLAHINARESDGRIRFHALAEHYLDP